mmetsp:Transcript_14193/g.19776  ORF Transcript_14193/g.19776 Transcript_14193/m.19776 type:complete len:463 (+) Transcript_14193:57-1445(+)
MDSSSSSEAEQTRRSTPSQIDVDAFKNNNFLHTGNILLHPALFVSHTDSFHRMKGEYAENNDNKNQNLIENNMGENSTHMSGPWAESVDMVVDQQNENHSINSNDLSKNHPGINPMTRLNPQQKGQQLLHLLQRAKREHWNDIFVFCEQLETIPTALFEIQSLMVVDLRGNFLETVSPDIQRLRMLEELYLDSNKLKEIPSQLANIPSLRVLSCSRNKITKIPKELTILPNLTKLDVSYNLITEVPVEFSSLAERPSEQPRFVLIIEHNPLIELAPPLYFVISNVITAPSNPNIRIPVSLPFPTQIGNLRLFLGDHQCESNVGALQHRKITHIVLAASELTPHYEQHFVYSHLNIPIVDEAKSILPYLKNDSLFNLIKDTSQDQNRGVLICCQNGVTRSVAIAIGFLMRLWNVNVEKATQAIQQYYPLIHMPPEVTQQLEEYQHFLEHQDANLLAESFAKKL